GRADHRRNVEIAQRQLRRPNADSFVREAHRQRMPVGLAVNRHRADAQLLARANDAQGNLSAIRNQDFLKHSNNLVRSMWGEPPRLSAGRSPALHRASSDAKRRARLRAWFHRSSRPTSLLCPYGKQLLPILDWLAVAPQLLYDFAGHV